MNSNDAIQYLISKRNHDGTFSSDIFYGLSLLCGESCLELCIFRNNPNVGLEIFLLVRADDDKIWAGKLHIPGVRKLVTDTDDSCLRRLLGEVPFFVNIYNIQYCASKIFQNSRGTEFSDIRWVQVDYDRHFDKYFFPVGNLPNNIIDFQYEIIREALKGYFHG